MDRGKFLGAVDCWLGVLFWRSGVEDGMLRAIVRLSSKGTLENVRVFF